MAARQSHLPAQGRAGGTPPAVAPTAPQRAASGAGASAQPNAQAPPPQNAAAASPAAQERTLAQPTGRPAAPIRFAGLSGNEILDQAIVRLQSYAGIGARVRHRVELFDQPLMGAGHYWQGPSGSLQSRLELQLQTDKKVCSWLQVCDGETLWTYQQFVESRKLTKVDVRQVLDAQADSEAGPDAPLSLGIGGLPEMLRRLNQSFTFSKPEPGTLGQWPVVRLEGNWRPGMLAKLLPEQAKAIEAGETPNLSKLEQHVPHRVTLYLGQNDLFPYRIEYERPSTSSGQPMLAMEFFEVRFDLPVDPERFTYRPSYRRVEDHTSQYIEKLR